MKRVWQCSGCEEKISQEVYEANEGMCPECWLYWATPHQLKKLGLW